MGPSITAPVAPVIGTVKDAVTGLFDIARGDFTGLPGFEEDSPFVAGLFRVREAIASVVDFIRENWQPVLGGLAIVIAGLIVPAFTAWAGAAAAAAAAQLAAAAPVIAVIAGLTALGAAVYLAYQRWEGFRTVVDAVGQFLTGTVLPLIQQFASWVAEQFGAFSSLLANRALPPSGRCFVRLLQRVVHAHYS